MVLSLRVICSDDHGETWRAGEAVNDNRPVGNQTVPLQLWIIQVLKNTESTVVQKVEQAETSKLFMHISWQEICRLQQVKDGGRLGKDVKRY